MSPTKASTSRPTSTTSKAAGSTGDPGRLIGVDWLSDHLQDSDLRIVHVAPDRRVYNKRHLPGATYSDLHKEIALKGTAPETGDAEREWLIPTAEQTAAVLRRWRIG